MKDEEDNAFSSAPNESEEAKTISFEEELKSERERELEIREINIKSEEAEVGLEDILESALSCDASDVHFAANERIAFRVNGELFFVKNTRSLSESAAEKLCFELLKTEEQKESFLRTREIDTAYEFKNGTIFRVNLYFKRGKVAAALRIISNDPLTMEEIGFPVGVEKLLEVKQGLLLVAGPTGAGKSTSMQAMLQHINETRVQHIITIEDPIEFVFKPKKSIFSQREVGVDTMSFSNSLRAALREDPDIVMIGEMRDPETTMAAINLAETGHLVISTLHTSGAPQTISRLINSFPADQQSNVQNRLADALVGVLSQRLVPRADQKSRVAIFELMIVNGAIRNIIRTDDLGQLPNAIFAGRNMGMVTMEHHAKSLAEDGVIKEEDYINFFREE